MTRNIPNHTHSSTGDGGGSISPEVLENANVPPDGADLANYLGTQKTIILRPEASYVLSEPIGKYSDMLILGLGGSGMPDSQPIVEYEGPTGAGTSVIDWSDETDPISSTQIRNVMFDGGGAETGLFARYMTNWTALENCGFSNLTGNAFDVSFAFFSWLSNCVARGNIGGDGFYIHETDGDVTDFTVNNPRVSKVDGWGLDSDASYLIVERPTFEMCDYGGMRFTGQTLRASDIYCEANASNSQLATAHDLYIDADTVDLNIRQSEAPAAGIGVGVYGNTAGTLNGGLLRVEDTNNRPDFFIYSESPYFDAEGVRNPSAGEATPYYDMEGRIYQLDTDFFDTRVRDRDTPTDLSGETGRKHGETRYDDGTNTDRFGTACMWDEDTLEWVPQDGSTTFA